MEETNQNVRSKLIGAIVTAVAIALIAALAFGLMNKKDPKDIVIDAFKGVYAEKNKNPMEELFGLAAFGEANASGDVEAGYTIKLDDCSVEEVGAYAGSGLSVDVRQDWTNKKSGVNMGVIYNGMDLAHLEIYYGDETLMASLPELSQQVFVLDLSDGLAERVKSSPAIGPMLEEEGISVDDISAYLTELQDQVEKQQENGGSSIDVEALWNRYKEGSKAQENFKEALTVTEGDKAGFTVNGRETSCQGYQVLISKDSMISFLRESVDFFLQDEELKEAFLEQLEASVRMSRLISIDMTDTADMEEKSPDELQQEAYDDAREQADMLITELDKSLQDMEMTVYVDKSGNLAAVDGTTAISMEEDKDLQITFSTRLEGGTYPTENMNGTITMGDGVDDVTIDFTKNGTYDGTKLTGALSVNMNLNDEEAFAFNLSGSYDGNDGAVQAASDAAWEGEKLFTVSVEGVVEQLEKGKSIHLAFDSIEGVFGSADPVTVTLSGDGYFRPLSEEVTEPEGTRFDVVAATEEEWSKVGVEIMFKALTLAGQLK